MMKQTKGSFDRSSVSVCVCVCVKRHTGDSHLSKSAVG